MNNPLAIGSTNEPIAGLRAITRRHFLGRGVSCLGAAALSTLLGPGQASARAPSPLLPLTHVARRSAGWMASLAPIRS
jgi:hypothetical protein